MVFQHNLLRLVDSFIGRQGMRGSDDNILETLDLADFLDLPFAGKIPVNDPYSAELGYRDRETRIGDCIHSSGNQWDIQFYFLGKLGRGLDLRGYHFRCLRHNQYVVKCKAFGLGIEFFVHFFFSHAIASTA